MQLRITGPNFSQIFTIPRGRAVIGRWESTDLQLNHPQVLRRHAQLEADEQGCRLIRFSGGSVLVNGREIAAEIPTRLSLGDLIQIGPFRLIFEEPEEETAVVEEPILSEEDLEEVAPETAAAGPPPPPSARVPRSVMAAPPPPPDHSRQQIPGLGRYSVRYANYLPRIYQTDFMSRFLAIFEAILLPVQWNVENFDLYLDPGTAPDQFLHWMGSWFGITFDETWPTEKRRVFLKEAHQLYARRGTKWSLTRLLEIYTGRTPEIIDDDSQPAFTFTVKLSQRQRDLRDLMVGIERIIEANKPVYTSYQLEFGRRADLDEIIGRF
jgi:phage tail-like protein